VEHRGRLSLDPFLPSHISHGLRGLAAGFPLAVYLFVGWENSAALAEETENPRRDVGRAVFSSIAIMTVSYVLFAYATVTGFGYDVTRLGASPIPFVEVAQHTLGALAFLTYLGGLTSTLGVLIAGINSQARLVFNAGREGLLPSFFGYVHPIRRTPNNAIITFAAISLLIIGGWGLGHLLGSAGGSMDPVVFFTESIDPRRHPDPAGLPGVQHRPAAVLPQVPAAGVPGGPAPGAARARHPGHPGPAVLPRQAGPARSVQLVPLRGAGRPGRRRRLRRPPGPPRPDPGRTRRLRRRRRGLNP